MNLKESPEYLEKVFASAKEFRTISTANSSTMPIKSEIDGANINSKECPCPSEKIDDKLSQNAATSKSKKNKRGRKNRAYPKTLSSPIENSHPTIPEYDPPIPPINIEQQYINYVISLLEENYVQKFLSPQKLTGNQFIKPTKSTKIAPFNLNLPVLNISKCSKSLHRNQQSVSNNEPSSTILLKPKPRKLDFKKSKKSASDFKTKHLQLKMLKKNEKSQKQSSSSSSVDRWDKYKLRSPNKIEILPSNCANFIALKGKFSQNLNWQNLRVAQELLPRNNCVKINENLDTADVLKSNMFHANMQNLLTACGDCILF